MAQIETTAKLVRLSDTELTIANPAEDIRGRAVVDRDGEDIGKDTERSPIDRRMPYTADLATAARPRDLP